MPTTKYIVSGSHPSAKYAADRKEIAVHQDSEGFFANAAPYGCGKTRATAEEAIRSLLGDNGVENIIIHKEDGMETQKINLTLNEKMVMVCIARNLMTSANGGMPKDRSETLCYTDQILSDGPAHVDNILPRSLPGIMSSLQKKGLVCSGDNATSLTEVGFQLYVEVVEPWYQEFKAAKAV